MSTVLSRKSTIVLNAVSLAALRVANRVGGQFAPDATARRAARLLCTPFAAGRLRARDAGDDGALREDMRIDGRRVAVYRWGDPQAQPRVLLAHGWSSYALRFLPWVRALREAGYAVTAFDQPGHGRSDAGRCTLACFARTLRGVAGRHGPFDAIVAHSMGGTAAMLALAEGTVAQRVVLIAPAADPDAATTRFARKVGLVGGIVPRIQRVIERQTGTMVHALTAHVRAPALAVPALVIHDLADTEVPWEEGESYARLWPGARLLSTAGLGHSRIVNDPSTIEAGLRFLRGEDVGERVVSSPNLPFGVA
ncbi:MAG: alpha/beta fold hydrolase [Rhodanobacteraceae bacterium]|nr:MAG: alpha/beta fold hydrolase [Rhodanobacteraceae bacterium]